MTQAIQNICDSCMNAGYDEGGFGLDEASMAMLLTEMGADMADHICDGPESGEQCGCACQRRNFAWRVRS